MKFGSVLTISGQAKIAAAMQPGGTPLTITEIALGDGGGAAVIPSENRAELMHELHRQPIDSAEPHPTDATSVVIQAVIPPLVGGFWIREIGLYDLDGDLVAYGSFPATEKPVLSAGVGRELIIRTHLAVASTEAVTVLIDPSIIYASQTWVQQKIDTHTHPISQVIDLQSALDSKAAKDHTHTSAEILEVNRARRYFLNQI